MTKNNLVFITIMLAAFLQVACNKSAQDSGRNPCLEPKRYYLAVKTCKPADTGSIGVDSTLPSAIVGFVDTNIWFTDGKSPSADLRGPLSGTADSVRWFIQPDTLSNNRDTLTFYYERKPLFLSSACGYAFVYSLQRVSTTENLIDSARIEIPDVNSATDIIHVKIFY